MSTCYSICFQQTATYVHESISRFFNDIDWLNEIKLVGTAVLIGSVISSIVFYISQKYSHWFELESWLEFLNLTRYASMISGPTTSQRRRGPTCGPRNTLYNSTRRTTVSDVEVYIFAWPSRGGVIILDHAEAADLEFLGLDPLDPPAKRLDSQTEEDTFCQRLLLLGGKWWDSEARWRFLNRADELDYEAIQALEEETEPAPTSRERRWFSVGWPTTGGLWVSEYDTNLWGMEEQDRIVPYYAARLKLARTMDERCQVLQKHFQGRFYKDVSEYKGHAFISSWGEKEAGEVGPLEQRKFLPNHDENGVPL